jgi:hypothetical protein
MAVHDVEVQPVSSAANGPRHFFREAGRHQLAMAGARAYVWDWQPGEGELYVSPEISRALGQPAAGFESAASEAILEIMHPSDRSAYLAAVTKEIDDAEAADSGRVASRKPPPADRVGRAAAAPAAKGETSRNDRDLRRELSNLERSIAKLDTEKKQANAAMLAATDAAEALRLHTQLTAVTAKLAEAEERWLAIQDQLGAE